MMPTHWRLIWSPPSTAAENMAVDEAIFEQVAAGDSAPALRIYGWMPPGVSVGYFQSLDRGVHLDAIAGRGYDLVRRPTGGRAIIHHHEVTYSVSIRTDQLEGGETIHRSYRAISRGIEAGLARLGIVAHVPKERHRAPVKGRDLPSVCFAASLGGDMEIDGRKIVGSAQMRRAGAILQHGSIPLRIDLDEHLDILGEPCGDDDDTKRMLRRAAVGVEDALGRSVSFEEVGRAVVDGFAEAFGLEFDEQPLSDDELAEARALVETKYSTDAWNLTRGRKGNGQRES